MAGFPRDSALRRFLWPRLYKYVDAFAAPTAGVAEQAARFAHLSPDRFKIIANPVMNDRILRQADEKLEHRWFNDPNAKVVLSVGRLTVQKDFPTLLRAFALAQKQVANLKLLIIGEGEQHDNLAQLARELGVTDDFELYGADSNPYKFMKRASAFVMSSLWEGPGHALIEAVSLGAPSVSTDCPSGPRETTLNGKAGLLTPVGEPAPMARAIVKLLTDARLAASVSAAGRANADRFMEATVAKEWSDLIETTLAA